MHPFRPAKIIAILAVSCLEITMTRNVNAATLALNGSSESCRLTAYLDGNKIPTIR